MSIAIAATLLGVGVPLMIYGATAKRTPRAQVGLSPNGLFLSGTF